MKILIIGKGGREHALAWKSKQSKVVKEVFVAPGNAGMQNVATLVNIKDDNKEALLNFAISNKIDLTIVGPETSLAMGVVDIFQKNNLKIFGPTQAAAQIESSKDFCKQLMSKYNIPTATYKTFNNKTQALDYLKTQQTPFVIKEDGLKAGKGVTIATDLNDAMQTLEIAFSIPNNKVVIEEYLDGFEFSLIALVNKKIVVPFNIAQDHKKIFDNDEGANTGGMGAYSPVKKITQKIIEEAMQNIMLPMAQAMVKEQIPFTGFLYGGFMLTDKGVKTIEFNARFGDPEAEILLPKLQSDLIQNILEILDNKETQLTFDNQTYVGVVMASKGYPESSTKNGLIEGLENLESQVFHMGTTLKNNQWLTNGGRVLLILNKGKNLDEAREKVYQDIKKIKSDSLIFRTDIGLKDTP